ncbi:MAG: cytochrome c [Bacteroidota bacterium]
MNRLIAVTCLSVMCAACTGKTGNSNSSVSEEVKLEQYIVEGRTLYLQHCSSCHQANGQGLARLYPPLNNSDYLNNNVEKVVCNIKYGMSGPLLVNGIEYNQMMPGNPRLTPLEIAEITTYIYNSWGRSDGLVGVLDVEKYLNNCEEKD